MVSTLIKAKYLSLSLGVLILPSTESPFLKPNFLIWLGETYISSSPAQYDPCGYLKNPKPSFRISKTPPP